jgi:hypothetical protein
LEFAAFYFIDRVHLIFLFLLLRVYIQQMVEQLAIMAKTSPFSDDVGDGPNDSSLALVNASVADQAKRNQLELSNSVVDYVIEWENIVVTNVDVKLKEVKELKKSRSHYEDKVINLRETINKQESVGKSPGTMTEKLTRNEGKLKAAWEAHEAAAGRLCVLIETVEQQGWKDLYPLVMSTMKWEADRAAAENENFSKLRDTMDKMTLTFQNSNKMTAATKTDEKAAAVETDDEAPADETDTDKKAAAAITDDESSAPEV